MTTNHAVRLTRLATAVLVVCCLPNVVFGQATSIQLPAPRKDGGRPLMQVLQDRQSRREFSREPVALPTLSALLWAALGINRPDGHRTAPSASNRQEIDIYVARPDGLYLYE